MEPMQLNWIVNFIWGIADDVLRDLYVRCKYRDVILPMIVLRRLDAELDPELRDTEQIPLLEEGGIDAFIRREVLPYAPDAWIDESATKIGYEISFTRYFYKPQPLRTVEEIRADIKTLEQETEGLLGQILVETEGMS